MDMIPLDNQHGVGLKLLVVLSLNEGSSILHYMVCSILNEDIAYCTSSTNVIVTPEWSNDILVLYVSVSSWKSLRLVEKPFITKGNHSIFTDLYGSKRCSHVLLVHCIVHTSLYLTYTV